MKKEQLTKTPALLLLLEGIRPKTLIAAVAPVLIGTTLALQKGEIDLFCFLFTLLFALFVQMGTNLTNDFFDYVKGSDTAARKGPRRLTQSGLIPLPIMKRVIHLPFLCALLITPYFALLCHWSLALLSLLPICCGYLYTVGRFSISYLGLGELFVLLFFGEVATAGTAYLQTGSLSFDALIAGLIPGFFSTALLTANNLRDREEDCQSNKNTLPVRFGLRFGQCEYAFSLLFPFLVPALLILHTHAHSLSLLTTLPLLFLTKTELKTCFSGKEGRDFLPLLSKTGKLFLYFTLLFCIGWLI